jgi:2-polyprenyl-6-methoxyphenol hydroxylase-like FAD-dependent oxidoreductase
MYNQYMTIRAMVIGGGIAGPVTAMALAKAGVDAAVYEAYGHGSDGVGAFVTLAENGLEALRVLDLHDSVCELGMETPRMRIVNGRGKPLADLRMRARTVRRADLYIALRDEAERRGVPIIYGKRLVDVDVAPHTVLATFADGSTAQGDLLVGADGLRSRTRAIIDPNAPRARHIGLLNTGGFARGLRLPDPPGVANMVFGRRCFFGYFVHPDGDVWWFANPPSRREPTQAELAAVTSEQWRSRLAELFREDEGPMLDIIAATETIMPAWNTYDFPRVPKWHNDRMVIVGDAAHATSPSSGQGASMAIEDGVVLGKCLRDLPSTVDALAAFERERRQRVERVVKQGKRNGTGKAPGPAGALVRDLVMPPLMRMAAKRDIGKWMYDYRIDWTAGLMTSPRPPR